MKVEHVYEVPTGHILKVTGDNGYLEMVSLSDYGKDVNLKCDAMGLSRYIEKVVHTDTLPLTKKWVITVSTQYGCPVDCKFCDASKGGSGTNATYNDLVGQVETGLGLHPDVTGTERLNIHYARMGEPTYNFDVLKAAEHIQQLYSHHHPHQVVSTMMPRANAGLHWFLERWMHFKNEICEGNAGLQLSINTTDDRFRNYLFNGRALPIAKISDIINDFPVRGRKITLNFAIAYYSSEHLGQHVLIDAKRLAAYFPPEKFIVKLTPMHNTAKVTATNAIYVDDTYTTMLPYKHFEEQLKEVGFDVLVFIASAVEDASRITCGNLVMAGNKPAHVISEGQHT